MLSVETSIGLRLGAKRRTTARIKPTPGGKAGGFAALRGSSAAPSGSMISAFKVDYTLAFMSL